MPVISNYSKTKRVTACLLLFLQLFFPVSTATLSVAYAAEQNDALIMSETFDGLNALMDTYPEPPPPPQSERTASGSTLSGEGFTVEMPSGSEYGVMPAGSDSGFISGQNGMPFPMSVSTLPAPRDNTVQTDDIFSALPTLGLPDTSPEDETVQNEARLAGYASQTGQILSADDAMNASLGYVRGIGENLLNQQVNDWLNQVGHARILFGSNKTGDADILVPLIDNPNSLFFSQVGLRANDERTTTNLGLGYRQYEDGWMWGVNSFYDYDITGSNSRVGVGGELWANYLKFAANGYFRVTDWHQSKLHEMRDYDERPANGFDIRAEGYLPDYPQLGAFAKYEQYFGDGISLAATTSSGELKSNPSVSTLGLSYTPFPLITFKGQTSRGDSGDSQVGMELSYRFGVPLSQQLDTGNVALMRNLAGNRYDFVDRNYNIVMQYRKQDLLQIALPQTLRGEAAQTQPVTVSVLKAKYGLKSLRWSAPELLANGGKIKQTGLTTADITLPAYIFASRSGEPQGYRVTAVGEDNEGNPSNTAEMWVNVIPSVETVTQLAVTPNQSLVANNRDQFTAAALLQNDKGEVLPDKAVTFSVSGLKNPEGVTIYDADGNHGQTLTVISGPDGTATVKIISKSAGKASVQAKMNNGNSRAESIIYIADLSTAKINTLELTNNKAVADGQAKNIAVATVTDQFDNRVENFPLTASADNGATVIEPDQQTDDNGQITVRFSSETAGDSRLVVEGTGTSKSVTAQFVADMSTAQIQSVTTENDGAVANGQAKNSVLVTVTDNRNNSLAGAPVTISVPGTARYQTQPVSGITDNQGRLRVDITNTKAGSEDYTFSINDSSVTRQLVFKPDESTATMTDSQLKIVTDGQKADGTSVNRVQATVLDAYGNRIQGYTVQFVTDNNALPSESQLTTDNNGEAVFELTNTRAGKTKVTAEVNSNTASANVTFIADSTTAQILPSNLIITADNSIADGISVNSVNAIVTDEYDNVVPYTDVIFTTDNGATPDLQSLTTDELGEVTFNMTSTHAGQVTVKAEINSSNPSVIVTFKADSANPDAQKSSLTAEPETITADGKMASALHFTLKDSQGNLIPDQTVRFESSLAGTTVSNTIENPDGSYTANLQGTKVGSAEISIMLNGSPFDVALVTVRLTADSNNLDKDKSVLTATPLSIVANNTETSVLTLTLKDENDNPVSGERVEFTTELAEAVFSAVTDNGDGSYTASLKGTKAGDAVIKVTVNETLLAISPVTVKLTADSNNLDKNKSVLTATPLSIVANNTETSVLTLTLKDGNDNPVSGERVEFTTELAEAVFSAVTDNGDGNYTASLKGTKAGSAEISIMLNGSPFDVAPVTVRLTADSNNLDKDKSVLTATPLSIVANNTETSVLTLTLKDGNDNPVSGERVEFTTELAEAVFSAVTDNGDGSYTASLKGTKAGDAVIKVTVNETLLAISPVTVKLTADSNNLDKDKSVLTATPLSIVANNTETSVLTLTLKDGNDNPVSGERVEFTTELAEAVFSAVTDNGDGNYTASLKGTKAGSAEISVMLDGSPFDVTPVTVKLTGDPNTAVLESVILDDEQIRKVANGTDYFEFIAAVRDSNNNPVSNIAVNWLTSAGNKVILSQPETQTDAEGNAKIRVISTKTPAKDIIVSASLGSQSMDADKHVSFEELLSISGFVIDATKQGDTPVNGADVKIFTEDMQSVAFEKKLNATGKFTAELFSGNYVIIITADGYDDYREPLNINSANTNFKFGLSPILGSLSARIILQWSTAPDDLDMYLLVPPESGGNSRIKVSYQNTSPQGADATLDNDDKAAPGIETITINKLHKGTYTLYVQNYSGPDAKLSTAQVQLNLNNNLTLSGEGTHNMKFYAPDAVVPKSDYWIVFDMIVDNDNNVQIIKRNTVSVSEP